ncbi:MAG: S9 family peptidase [Bacteroidia bacterium]
MRILSLFVFLSTSVYVFAQEKLSNELIWNSNTFQTDYVWGINSMNDGEHYTTLDVEDQEAVINQYSYSNYGKKVNTIVTSSDLKDENGKKIAIESYSFNRDESKLLIATEVESIYRHSSKGYYYIYDRATKTTIPLSDKTKGKQRLAEISPTGDRVAFVRDNNLFIKNLNNNKEVQVTDDGEYNKIINGATDWVYEEEFGFDKGFQWSPTGRYIAYYKFDESHVKEFQMAMYGTLYPEQYKFKYPKAGEDNSVVTIHVAAVGEGYMMSYPFPLGDDKDIYVPRIKWAGEQELCVFRMNRWQNKLELLVQSYAAPFPRQVKPLQTIYSEESRTYIDINDDLTFLKNENAIIYTSEKNGFNHIYKKDITTGKETQLTQGNWEVTKVYGVDENDWKIYYQAAESSPINREVYSIDLKGKNKIKLSKEMGTNDAQFSNSFKYYINFYSNANTPPKITLHNNLLLKSEVLKDNAKLQEQLKKFSPSPIEFFSFKTSENIELNGYMIKPKNFDANKKYPVLMYVYNGPGINTVNNSWGGSRNLWFQYLAQEGYVIVSVDGRGTGYRGRDFKHVTYRQLGKYETIDQIEAAKYLGNLSFVDKSRIGIFGWSYGGYMSSLCITKGADYFKAAIAVAPVTNWRYYDNIYTERFMRKPQDNGENYDSNSPINHVEKLKGNYLLIHGSADDNVHYQNTMEMITALTEAGKQFDLFIYPNKNHGIGGRKTRIHLYTLMTNFLLENL